MGRRAVLYARVSGDDRHNESRNLQGQLDMCRGFALARGYEIVAELAEDDRGASGAAFELPQLNQVRALATARAYDVLITRELDRLSRRLAKQLFVEDELQRHGVTIEYALAEYAPTPEGGFLKNIRASFAEYERLKIAERMTRGKRLKAAAGSVFVQGNPPYGYRAIQDGQFWRLVLHPEEAETVRDIFTWYVGGLTMSAIQKRLSEQGVPTAFDGRDNRAAQKRRGYGEWSRAAVGNILRNETYCGRWHYGKGADDAITVTVPAIVDEALWERAQARVAYNVEHSPRGTTRPYLLRRRVYCSRCGSKLRASYAGTAEHSYLYYRCPATSPGDRAHDCDLPAFPAVIVDDVVWAWVRRELLAPDVMAAGLRRLAERREEDCEPIRRRVEKLEHELGELDGREARLAALYVKGLLPEGKLDQMAAELLSQRRDCGAELARLRAELNTGALSEGVIDDLATVAAELREGLELAGGEFEFRQFVVERLDIRAALSAEEGTRWVEATTALTGESFARASHNNPDSCAKREPAVILRARFSIG